MKAIIVIAIVLFVGQFAFKAYSATTSAKAVIGSAIQARISALNQ